MLRNTSEWGRVHGGEFGSAAEQRVTHTLGVVRNDATGGGGASARLTAYRFRGGTRWPSRDTTNGHVGQNWILKSTKLIHSDCNLLPGPFAVQFSRGHVEKVS